MLSVGFVEQFVHSLFVSVWHCDLCTLPLISFLFFLTEEKTKHGPPTIALPVKRITSTKKVLIGSTAHVYC